MQRHTFRGYLVGYFYVGTEMSHRGDSGVKDSDNLSLSAQEEERKQDYHNYNSYVLNHDSETVVKDWAAQPQARGVSVGEWK